MGRQPRAAATIDPPLSSSSPVLPRTRRPARPSRNSLREKRQCVGHAAYGAGSAQSRERSIATLVTAVVTAGARA
jgi:hypothetical protein